MTKFGETRAAEIDLDSLPSGNVTYITLVELEEVNFTVLDARIVKSNFNEEQMTAQITLVYPDQDEDTDTPLQFSSQQAAIMKQVRDWLDEKVRFPVEDVTVRIYGENYYGKAKYCLAEAVPDSSNHVQSEVSYDMSGKPHARTVPSKHVRDMREDATREMTRGRIPGHTSPKDR